MWLIMGIEQPFITAVLARMAEAKIQLAAFGLAFSLSLIVESPIIQMLAAGTALASSYRRYKKLLNFMHVLACGLTLLHILIAIPPVYTWLVGTVIGVPLEIIEPSRLAFTVMIPWSSSIGYRRLWQGVLIHYGRSDYVSYSMISRLVSMLSLTLVGYFFLDLPGAVLGGLVLIFSVVAGTVSAYIFARPVIRLRIPKTNSPDDIVMGWKELVEFYVPLSLTSIILLAARSVISVGLAQAPRPLDSLAIFPVLMGFIFLFQSITLALQEVTISSLASGRATVEQLKKFSTLVGLGVSTTALTIAVTPLRNIWYRSISSLPEDLLPFTPFPTIVMSLALGALAFVFMYRGILVHKKRTVYVSKAVGINACVLLGVLFAGAFLLPVPGIYSMAVAFLCAACAEAFYLTVTSRRVESRRLEG